MKNKLTIAVAACLIALASCTSKPAENTDTTAQDTVAVDTTATEPAPTDTTQTAQDTTTAAN